LAQQINSTSEQVTDSSQSLSQGATESTASLEEISSSLNEMSSQTKLNAENANQANLLSVEVKQAAEEGNTKMERMVSAMAKISDAGQNINKIIKVIDEIAFHTNLLTLNAALEVACSAKTASETAELADSVEKTENGAIIANQTAESLEAIFDGVSRVSDLAEEIAAASNERAEGVPRSTKGWGR